MPFRLLKMMHDSPIVVPIFISNLGCPHRCVFCDQRQFSDPIPPEDIPEITNRFINFARQPEHREKLIAFYGGSFTGLDRPLLEKYLDIASSLVKEGVVDGLKASTRPDMVSHEILEMLVDAGFVELELGVQSMDDKVLKSSLRGHSANDVFTACHIVKESGLRLGMQIMPGLPGEDRESFRHTVEVVTSLRPDTTRIYPTVVMSGTGLEKMYIKGRYTPLDLDEAILRSLFAYITFTTNGSKVLRIGLPQSDRLNVVAGPFHPAFGFLVRSRAYRIMVEKMMDRFGNDLCVKVNPKDLPSLIGHRKENVLALNFSFDSDSDLPRESVSVENTCLGLGDIIGHIL